MKKTRYIRIGGYTIRPTMLGQWALFLTSTNEHLRNYPTREKAIADAERYARMTAAGA